MNDTNQRLEAWMHANVEGFEGPLERKPFEGRSFTVLRGLPDGYGHQEQGSDVDRRKHER